VQSIHSMPQVEAAEGRHSITVRYRTGSGQWGNLKLTVIADYKNISVTEVFPQAGAWPPPRKEALLERASVGFTNRNIGDDLLIETPQGKQRTLRVAGTVHDMNEAPPLFTGQAYGYITSSTLEWLGYDRGYTELLVRFPAEKVTSKAAVQALADEVQAKLERSGHTVGWTYVPEPGKHPIDEIIAPMAVILGVLGFLALLLSGFLVINTISAVLTQQVRQIGIMKTIGARNGQIMGLYYSMVFVFSVLALCLGVPAGAMGGQGVGGYMASLINFDISTKGIPHQVLGLEIAVGLLVPFLAALWPVWSGARISIRLALNGRGIGKGGISQGYVDRILEQIRGLSRPVLLSLRNTFRRKGRLSLTLATLTLGGAIFVAVLTVHASLGQTLNDALNYWRYDVQISFGRTYRTGQLIRVAQQTPGAAQAECWTGFGARRIRPDGREGDNFELLALPVPSDFIIFIVMDF
jgi:putative ABC transport system permease protein